MMPLHSDRFGLACDSSPFRTVFRSCQLVTGEGTHTHTHTHYALSSHIARCCQRHFLQTVGRAPFHTKLPYLYLFFLPSAVTVYPHTLWTFGISIVQQCVVCPVCVSVLLSHTVLSELYQEKLVTEDEVERMKEEAGHLPDRVVTVQCTKPPEVVTRTTDVLDKYGYNEEAKQLRGW